MSQSVDEAVAALFQETEVEPVALVPNSFQQPAQSEDRSARSAKLVAGTEAWQQNASCAPTETEMTATHLSKGKQKCSLESRSATAPSVPSEVVHDLRTTQSAHLTLDGTAAQMAWNDVDTLACPLSNSQVASTHPPGAHDSDTSTDQPSSSKQPQSTQPASKLAASETGEEKNPTKRTSAKKEKDKIKLRAWTDEEHERFLYALDKFRTEKTEAVGPSGERSVGLGPGTAELIAMMVGTRSAIQVRSHAQKHFKKQRKLDAQAKGGSGLP